MKFDICLEGKASPVLFEESIENGVKKIIERFALDVKLACGKKPELFEMEDDSEVSLHKNNNSAIFIGTYGKSGVIRKLISNGIMSKTDLENKRECYFLKIITEKEAKEAGLPEKKTLVILGSDKRGTIYGIFNISERFGVTSLVYYGDSKPVKKDTVRIELPFAVISKEPSVEYRGFFINDEWPAFGNWSLDQFGGVNAKCYEEIFIFLLRMKGNFLWPAMWASVFSEDGPGIENARLADELGVVMGTSHHEPLFRAGEEWQRIYKEYGDSNDWSFISNKEAITKFWIDGVKRNKDFESLVTIGMRGEADSKLLPENATMADNIQVVVDAIRTQNNILKEYMNEDLTKVNRVLAIYKEVEDYYYGDENTKGLKDYEELEDVIFLLSDDNFANTRGLPTEEERSHRGGYGMYYHFDYHGGPISYEWQNTSRLSKINEQMTMAYEYGVKKLWVVNVGDIKGYEYPLTYFLDLAYDIEKYGKINVLDEYVTDFVEKHFPEGIGKKQQEDLLYLIEETTRLTALRRPESLNQNIYHPVNYNEAERIIEKVDELIKINERIHDALQKGSINKNADIDTTNALLAYESVFYYQFAMSLDIIGMQAEASINTHLAKHLSLTANIYADRVKNRINRIENCMDKYNKMQKGKWNHMLESGFTGLRNWCDTDWGYPVISYVTPIKKGKIMVGFRGDARYHLGKYWQDGEPICNREFLRPDTKNVSIYLDSRGSVDFTYEVKCDKEWAIFNKTSGKVKVSRCPREVIDITVDNNKLNGEEKAYIDIDIKFANGDSTQGNLAIVATNIYLGDGIELPDNYVSMNGEKNVFVENDGVICFNASHFADTHFVDETGYRIVKYLGREKDAVKCIPTLTDFTNAYDKPYLRYDFVASESGKYTLEADVLARNPIVKGEAMIFGLVVNDGRGITVNTVKDDFYSNVQCEQWSRGVLDNVRRITTEIDVKEGLNHLFIYALSPNVSFDKFVIYKEGCLKESYMGPEESYKVKA